MTQDRQDNDRRTSVRRSSDRNPVAYAPAFHDDEISLADLVQALWHHRCIALGVALSVTALSHPAAPVTPPQPSAFLVVESQLTNRG